MWAKEDGSRPCINLRCVECAGPRALDVFLEAAGGHPTLSSLCGVPVDGKVLNVRLNNLTAQDVRLVAFDLRRNLSLTTLDISQNNIGLYGALILSEALRETRFIRNLKFDSW